MFTSYSYADEVKQMNTANVEHIRDSRKYKQDIILAIQEPIA